MMKYQSLKVWKRAHNLVLKIYKSTRNFPKAELYGLTNQLNRAVVSVAANIAEGSGKFTDKDFAHYIQIAIGSIIEVDYFLLLSRDLEILNKQEYALLQQESEIIRRMLINLMKKLRFT